MCESVFIYLYGTRLFYVDFMYIENKGLIFPTSLVEVLYIECLEKRLNRHII